jgi:hypothetical protein
MVSVIFAWADSVVRNYDIGIMWVVQEKSMEQFDAVETAGEP